VLSGVKVIEAAEWVMAPSAGAILADWGADVLKIEQPGRGDTVRSILRTLGYEVDFDVYTEQNNRNKKSIGLDLNSADGREVFLRLVADADVLITSYLESKREKWGITYEDLRKINPRLIYARSTGQGPKGPEGRDPGYDSVAFWARSSMGHMARAEGTNYAGTPSAGIGDITGGISLAAGIAAALAGRAATGNGALVDVSLLNVGVYLMYEVLEMTKLLGFDPKKDEKYRPGIHFMNPLSDTYVTEDDRGIFLGMLNSDAYWDGFCRAIGRDDLIDDPRYTDFASRAENRVSLTQIIREAIGRRPLSDLMEAFREHGCVAAPFSSPREVLDDVQVAANGYFVPHPRGKDMFIVANPVQFNGEAAPLRNPAPAIGEDTDQTLTELGFSPTEIEALRRSGAVG
jgi:crotonobetainyl-CoA:carnitine CoA-transferase CaiB-like acyl-CoA transferase